MKKFIYFLTIVATTYSFSEWKTEDLFFEHESLQQIVTSPEPQEWSALKRKLRAAVKNTWCSEDKALMIADVVRITKPRLCVEVGAFSGSSAIVIAECLKQLSRGKLFAVDAWSNKIATQYMPDSYSGKDWWSKVSLESTMRDFKVKIGKRKLKKYCAIVRKSSAAYAQECPSVDFLHLDGDITEQGSFEDVTNYLPKVKAGGCILLSNAYSIINSTQSKAKSIMKLMDTCEIVGTTDNDNTLLFQKN